MSAPAPAASPPRWRWLPPIGSWRYYALLGALGILVLGPLGGVTAAYMNFSIGFFIGGQVLAGILGSTVTYGYGAEGKHGANYMQTAAASVAGLSAMAVVIQAMAWLGLPVPPTWQLVLYILCIGMFGAGVGMLYTPVLVDRLQLPFPSGLAVANILRALTDPQLLRRSIGKLGGGVALGLAGGVAGSRVALLGAIEFSASTFGAGMIVGARIGIPALLGGLIGAASQPYFVSIGWLGEHDPFRKITFLIALGMIMGAALVDLGQIFVQTLSRWRELRAEPPDAPEDSWRAIDGRWLAAWIVVWGTGVVLVGAEVMRLPVVYLVFAVLLVFVFAMVNGISLGISDSNPISSAFVVTVVLMAAIGLRSPEVGLMAASILLVGSSVACDMQQDRSTGWRLGTSRRLQFRFQALGVVVGALLAVGFAKLFMAAYPVLALDQTTLPAEQQPAGWTSAMTYKIVGTLRSITGDQGHLRNAIWIGVGMGGTIELARFGLQSSSRWRAFVARGKLGFASGFAVDALLLPSPYALSFGGFVNLGTSAWFAAGAVLTSLIHTLGRRPAPPAEAPGQHGDELPPDMSSMSLLGGGLIAGDALAALGLGIAGLIATLAG